jgi:MFS-type transporter involved in bile tolerance (Atg22 family)
MEVLFSVITILSAIFFGMIIGILVERVRWNGLIKEGKLPKPNKPWRYK